MSPSTPKTLKLDAVAKPPKKLHADPHVWIKDLPFDTTQDVEVPTKLIDQVLGQEAAVSVARKAAEQGRHLLLIGDPGTGKSMLAKAMTEILPESVQKDVLTYHNNKNPNQPRIMETEGSQGRLLVAKYEKKAQRMNKIWRVIEWGIGIGAIAAGLAMWWFMFGWSTGGILPFAFCVMLAMFFLYFSGQRRNKADLLVPKLLIEHKAEAEKAPYVEGTGSHAGALLGDVRHDPFQSGGLETPPHQRVEVGAIHRANKGVLFIDEINVLRLDSQQALLTALQDKKYAIVGQSQSSSGAMIRTDAVPCDFILVAAGNLDAVRPPDGVHTGMHPALRSRIRGYGYEVFVNSIMEDTHANRLKLVQFVAQEVVRDGRIPHFEPAAVAEVIREAQRRSGRTGRLTLRLRELGGVVRTAGDFAKGENSSVVTLAHVRAAKQASMSLEQQITYTQISNQIADVTPSPEGSEIGVAHGGATVGTGEVGEPAGLVVPVEAAVVPALSRHGGAIVVGQGLKNAHSAGIENVGALLKILEGADIADYDVHVDARIPHPSASVEGIGIAAAVSAISALEAIPVRQEVVCIGTLSVAGELRAVGATLQALEAAASHGFKVALLPKVIEDTLLVDAHVREKIDLRFCANIAEVLTSALDAPPRELQDLVARLVRPRPTTGGNGHTKVTAAVSTRRSLR